MDELQPQANLPYPRFTDRARNAMMRAYRLAVQRNRADVSGIFVIVAAIESDEEIRRALPKLSFDTDALLATLDDVSRNDRGDSVKAILAGALTIAEPAKVPIDTLHLLKSAITNPNPTILAMLSALDVTPSIVLQTIEKLSPTR